MVMKINKVKVGDLLFCKLRGAYVSVIRIEDDFFYVNYKGKEYPQRYDEIDKILFFPNTIRVEKGMIRQRIKPMDYYDCAYDKSLLNKDIIYKQEVKYLAKTKDSIKLRIGELKEFIASPNYNLDRWTYSPSTEELVVTNLKIKPKDYEPEKELREIEKSDYKPYFARMDFKVLNKENINVYIGNRAVFQNGIKLVYDWREKLAQRYYIKNELNFNLNKQNYQTTLIRNFEYKENKLEKYLDTYKITNISDDNSDSTSRNNEIADEFLVKVLKEKRNVDNIGNIISSIQQNQNKIITEGMSKNLIVQGCAGSGKTMIMLHRLSYLMFNNKEVDLRRIKIITPNNLFELSINDLAKELDIDSIQKSGVSEYFIEKALSYGINITDIDSLNVVTKEMYEYVYSLEYLSMLNNEYLKYVKVLWDKLKEMGIGELIRIFNDDTESLLNETPTFNKIESLLIDLEDEFKKRRDILKNKKAKIKDLNKDIIEFSKNISKLEKQIDELKKDINKDIIEFDNKNKKISILSIKSLFNNNEKKKNDNKLSKIEKLQEIYDNKLHQKKELEKVHNSKVRQVKELEDSIPIYSSEAFGGVPEKEISKKIKDLLAIIDAKGDFIQDTIYNEIICDKFKELGFEGLLNNKEIKSFTIIYLLYIHKGSLSVEDKFIYVDEGQDLSYWQYYLINIINNGKVVFNIFSDVNQVIKEGKGIKDWNSLKGIFDFEKFNLNENYRNSKAVADNCINETGYDMKSLGIDDGKVVKTYFNDKNYKNVISKFKDDTSKRKVIIVKEFTEENIKFIKDNFSENEINILDNPESIIEIEKINVITVELVKGMEFDSTLVILMGMNNNEKYIALTRALINGYIISGELVDNFKENTEDYSIGLEVKEISKYDNKNTDKNNIIVSKFIGNDNIEDTNTDKEYEKNDAIIKEARKLRIMGQAKKVLEITSELYPENKKQLEDVILIRGAAFKDLRLFNESKKCVEEAINIGNKSPNPYNLGGVIELMMGNINTAELFFDKAIELKSTKIGMTNIEVTELLNLINKNEDKLRIIRLLKDKSPKQFEWLTI